MPNYWELETFDGNKTEISPAGVDVIKRRWGEGKPIHLKSGSFPANQIKSFTETNKVYSDQKLLEDAARAFKEPVIEDGNVMCYWVKKAVTRRQWEKYYAPHGVYRKLSDSDNFVNIAYRLPIHLITSEVSYCDDNELKSLTIL